MAVSLVSSAPLIFFTSGTAKSGTMTYKTGGVAVEKLSKACGPGAGPGESTSNEKLVAKLENLVLVEPSSEEVKGMRLCTPMNCQLDVELYYGALSPLLNPSRKKTGYLKILDTDRFNGPLSRLGRVCGGYQNLKADVKLEFGVEHDRKKLNVKGKKLKQDTLRQTRYVVIEKYFNFTQSLAQKWGTGAVFTGSISISLKLNGEAFNCIHLGGPTPGDVRSINKQFLDKADSTGDTMIIPADGLDVPCHKIFLIGQNEVFNAMFSCDMKEAQCNQVEMRDMTERGVRALLAYLYCQDIKEPAICSNTAAELLIAADKYGISKLFETMTDLILIMDSNWFSITAALKIASFVKNKADDAAMKEVEKKAQTALKSKSVDELEQCAEFREQFNNPESGLEMCCFLLQNK